VAQAIRYAVEVWNVDIISMSFGYESTVEVIDDALKFAGDSNVLLIAAASNVGGNTGRARRWPGTRDNVLSMCATEGNGFEYKGNPPPRENGFNFATLGVMVPVWTVPNGFDSSNQVYRSGTSISTPIAAAIAAAVIELIRHTEEQYVSQHLERERSDVRSRVNRAKKSALQASGMGKIFSLMAQKTGRYDYVQPTNLLTRYMTPMKLLDKILDKLDE
jgi:subtilisin family serine protease